MKLKEQREQGLHKKIDEQIFQEVLGKDTHGYLRANGPGRSITKHFQVKPSRLDLAQEVNEVKKTAEEAVLDAKKEAEVIRNEVDQKISENNKLWEKRLMKILQACGKDLSDTNDAESDESSS